MASVCIPATNFQKQHHHFQLMNGNIMLLQQHQQQQQQLSTQYVHKAQLTIAPAPPSSKVLGNSNMHNIQTPSAGGGLGPMLSKKKYTYNNMPYGEQQLPSVARRNARERNRVKQVNNGFSTLRQHLPQSVINALSNGGRGASKKLSKVDTLRIALEYIRGLKDLLDDGSSTSAESDAGDTPFILDECSNDGSNYDDFPPMDSPVASQYQLKHAYHSEASASPTPSFSDSDISIGGANYLQPLKQEESQQQQHQLPFPAPQMQFKFEPFEQNNYNQQLTNDEQQQQLEDEKLLEYISQWQEQ